MQDASSEITAPETAEKKRKRGIPFDKVNRRTHLYASMFFMPWMVIYGLSSAVLNHPKWFGLGPAKFDTIIDRKYYPGPVPPDGGLNAFAEKIQNETGLKGQYSALRTGGNVLMIRATFWTNTRISYDPKENHLIARKARLNLASVLTSMHERGGFDRPGFLTNLWSVIVDIVQVSIIIWIASGLYMWWHLKYLRNWGWLALTAGAASFAFFLLRL